MWHIFDAFIKHEDKSITELRIYTGSYYVDSDNKKQSNNVKISLSYRMLIHTLEKINNDKVIFAQHGKDVNPWE